MKVPKLIVALLGGGGVFFIIFLGFGFAGSASDMVLDQKKEELMEELYTNPDFLPLIDINKAKIQLQDLSKSFEQLNNEYVMYDEQRQEIEEKYGDVQLTIEKILHDSEKTKELIIDSMTKISLFKKNIENIQQRVAEMKVDITESKVYLEQYVAFLYKLYNDFYEKDRAISDIKLFVKSDNITDTLSSDTLVEMLTVRLQELLVFVEEKQRSYVSTMMKLDDAKRAYEEAATSLGRDMEKLEDQKRNLYELLSYLQADKEVAEARIAKMKESKDSLQTQLSKMRTISESEKGFRLNESSTVYELLNISDRNVEGNYFTRPVTQILGVQHTFKDPAYKSPEAREFDGIRLGVQQRLPVYAMAPGIVYEVQHNSDVSLNRISIIHKYGYTTFYAPMSDISVQKGQLVKRGQVIGYTGGEPGTKGAGLDSDGPHLDVFVLKNGEAVDPYTVLDLGVFNGDAQIPENYRLKYVQDTFGREVKINKVYELQGETVEERRDSFLNLFGSSPFASPSLWLKGAQGSGVDPVMGICIGFAETSFRNFASKNNIGNVYNNDRGDRVDMESPAAGVGAIFYTLNNKYLGSYYTLNELSRFGNSEGFIYASSPYNRQKNIMSCLSAIYGYPVPVDFPFRIN